MYKFTHRKYFLVFPRQLEQPRRVPHYVLVDYKRPGRYLALADEGYELVAPGARRRHHHLRFRRPVERHGRVEAAPVHALRHQLQIVDQAHELALGRLDHRQLLVVQVVAQYGGDAEERQAQLLDLDKLSEHIGFLSRCFINHCLVS